MFIIAIARSDRKRQMPAKCDPCDETTIGSGVLTHRLLKGIIHFCFGVADGGSASLRSAVLERKGNAGGGGRPEAVRIVGQRGLQDGNPSSERGILFLEFQAALGVARASQLDQETPGCA